MNRDRLANISIPFREGEDAESRAMRFIEMALTGLSRGAKLRILEYLRSKLLESEK